MVCPLLERSSKSIVHEPPVMARVDENSNRVTSPESVTRGILSAYKSDILSSSSNAFLRYWVCVRPSAQGTGPIVQHRLSTSAEPVKSAMVMASWAPHFKPKPSS